jgi:VanZ family protein
VVALLVVIVLVAMVLTSQQMSILRDAFPSLSLLISRLDHMDTPFDMPFDMPHVALFAMLGFALRVLLPGLRWWLLLLCIALLGATTEVLQFLTIGRTPRLLDARDDLVGACVGLLVGSLPVLLIDWWKQAHGTLAD